MNLKQVSLPTSEGHAPTETNSASVLAIVLIVVRCQKQPH